MLIGLLTGTRRALQPLIQLDSSQLCIGSCAPDMNTDTLLNSNKLCAVLMLIQK